MSSDPVSTERAVGPFLGHLGGSWAMIWAYFKRKLALLEVSGPGLGPFWAYFKPKSAHLGDLAGN